MSFSKPRVLGLARDMKRWKVKLIMRTWRWSICGWVMSDFMNIFPRVSIACCRKFSSFKREPQARFFRWSQFTAAAATTTDLECSQWAITSPQIHTILKQNAFPISPQITHLRKNFEIYAFLLSDVILLSQIFLKVSDAGVQVSNITR